MLSNEILETKEYDISKQYMLMLLFTKNHRSSSSIGNMTFTPYSSRPPSPRRPVSSGMFHIFHHRVLFEQSFNKHWNESILSLF